MVWVMDSYYGLIKKVIVEKINNLFQTPGITVINGDILSTAAPFHLQFQGVNPRILGLCKTGLDHIY